MSEKNPNNEPGDGFVYAESDSNLDWFQDARRWRSRPDVEAIASLESENARLAERVTELETLTADCHDVMVACKRRESELREQVADLQSQLETRDKRVAELEEELRRRAELYTSNETVLRQMCEDLQWHIRNLQSQLAWTPVSAGLPTEEGPYEFTHVSDDSAIIHDFELWLYNPHEDEFESVTSTDVYVRDEFLDNNYYTHYRRIELPKGGES